MSGAPTIDGYDYVRLLGRGGFSDVYLYRQRLPNRLVAIKVLRSDILNEGLRRQFTAEANLMAAVSTHPAIATIYAAGVDDEAQPYLVMEYCSGGSLGAVYRTERQELADVLRIGVRLASALETAHRSGIVHRDVKPANVLVTDYGSAVLTDFGISAVDEGFPEATRLRARAYATQSDVSELSLGMSIPWAAPEFFDDEPRPDARSDVFSLAATLYTLLEGRSPFESPTGSNRSAQLIGRIQAGSVTPFAREDVSDAVRDVLRTALSHDPAGRHPSALAFAEALQALEAESGFAPTRIEVPQQPAIPADVTSTAGTSSARASSTGATTTGTGTTGTDTILPGGTPFAQARPDPRPRETGAVSEPVPPPAPEVPQALERRRPRPAAIAVLAASALVVALSLGLGVPWVSAYSASLAAESATTPALDGLDITENGSGSWNVAFPGDLTPPLKVEGRVLEEGTSATLIEKDDTVVFSYTGSRWYYGYDYDYEPDIDGTYLQTKGSASGMAAYTGIDVVGMPVGTTIIAAAPEGVFALESPMDKVEMETQLIVITITDVQ